MAVLSHTLSDEFAFWLVPTAELPALVRLDKSLSTVSVRNIVAILLAPSGLIGSSSFLHVTRKCRSVWMSSNSDQIPPLTKE